MRLLISLLGVEILSVDFSIPRLGVFAPDSIPSSDEAVETWIREELEDE